MNERDYSEAALYEFLDTAAKRGLLKENTAKSRKAAASRVLSVLQESERGDLRMIDVEAVFHRFQNKQGAGYKPDSLQVYLSRVKTAVTDFLRWRENPSAFKSSTAPRTSSRVNPAKDNGGKSVADAEPIDPSDPTPPSLPTVGLTIPIPLREGLTVLVSNIPSDLTKAESERIAAIVRAYAVIGG